ncbi:DNA-binding protein [Arthrobacter sp. MYb211]|uniref:DNA-binding protein n=1 Tax=Micrococcaceae TaxID=1268 RepID=UPI000BB9BD4C|nr:MULTISPECIES: DNA-binding protein [Micrococcaceae]PCC30529.1 DNA-binding protein [Glutamicibacter sp. BW80]PQZ97626.1 DNA-binding protein [Arthrobacter sp. MYb224]PRA04143.1 DNA-binding protein [Arthrobacter sp. MYb229]PRA11639.1 DNA-binding protein [Arthrobacter sp. MYb221]PRB51945.1 DNA-binding protein [Arthrobacter sp. MYb216]
METELPAIGAPATRALLSAGITSLEQAGETGEKALLRLHGVGPKALRILREALDKQGLELRS